MTAWLELPREMIPDPRWDVALRAVRMATADLGLKCQPAVRFFDEGSVKSWTHGTVESGETTRPGAYLAGFVEHDTPSVWIRSGQSEHETLVTLFHEARHVADGPLDVTGRMDQRTKARLTEQREAEAEAYGRDMAAAYRDRPSGMKSARLRFPSVISRGDDVTSLETIRGIDERTTFGSDLWPTRPVIAIGVPGVPERPIAAVKSLYVEDAAELWAKAQIEKANAYRRYIQRLIDQGALDAKTLVPPHLIERRGDRITSLPVFGLQLAPVPA